MLLTLSLGCRDGCVCRRLMDNPLVQAARETVPPEQAQRDVTVAVSADAQMASTLCGMQVTGLANVTAVMAPDALAFGGTGRVRLRGNPLFVDGGVNVAGLVCIGVVAFAFARSFDNRHPTVWTLSSVTLHSVETPGVHWVAPHAEGHHSHHH